MAAYKYNINIIAKYKIQHNIITKCDHNVWKTGRCSVYKIETYYIIT